MDTQHALSLIPQLSASPTVTREGSSLGATTITWATGVDKAQVYVSENGKPEVLVASGPSGTMEIAWLQSGRTYEFRLYAKSLLDTPLAVVTVTCEPLPLRTVAAALTAYFANETILDDVAAMLTGVIRGQLSSEQCFRAFERHGLHITPVHFYSPIPEIAGLAPELFERASKLPGVDMNDVGQLALLREAFPPYRKEYESWPTAQTDLPGQFHLNNERFDGTDALVLYCMVRHFKPKRIMEVGSGFSSRVSAMAALRNGETSLTCIEPYPDDILVNGFNGLTSLIPKKVQEMDLGVFGALTESDILFIDTSHVVKIDGDVNYLFLEVLPRLQPGVIIHVHDIFFPKEYPRDWVIGQRRFWTEQYLLQSFLAFNSDFEVIFANSYIATYYLHEFKATFPTSPWWGGGSFWMRRKVHDQE